MGDPRENLDELSYNWNIRCSQSRTERKRAASAAAKHCQPAVNKMLSLPLGFSIKIQPLLLYVIRIQGRLCSHDKGHELACPNTSLSRRYQRAHQKRPAVNPPSPTRRKVRIPPRLTVGLTFALTFVFPSFPAAATITTHHDPSRPIADTASRPN